MPLTRYLVKNEYGLADPEMYRSADKDDPEALLEGVAMAGLVGLLRQLGDLAEFAAEIFHDLHEEVMATAARGHGLMIRIQQLEAEFPPIEKALLLQTNHSLYYTNSGVEWHPNLQMEQNLIARGDLPRFVMDSYEESRGPPRLFLLDKFDVAGAGACLKRYSDPSFFKVERLPDSIPTVEVHREKKVRKAKKKGARWRYGETPETVPASHAKLHQLFMEEQIENAYNDPKRRVKLKKRPLNGSLFDSKSGKSYMEKFVESPSPESKTIHEVSVLPLSLKWKQDDTSESGLEVVEVGTIRDAPSPNFQRKHFTDDLEDFEPTIDGERDEVSSTSHAAVEKKELLFNGDDNGEGSMDGYHSDEMTSEVDNYLDALATVESEMETDNDSRSRHNMTLLDIVKGGTDSDANEDMELQTETFGSQSVGHPASDDGDRSFGRSSSSQRTDRASRMGGSTQFVGDRFSKVFPPSDSTITDPGNLPDDQLTDKKEPFGMESKNTGVEGDAICDLRVASQTLCSANLESTCAPLNSGLRSSVGSEQDETKPDHIKDATGSSDSDEARTNLVDSSTLPYDNVPNHIEGDNLATISMKHLPVDELEDERLNGCPVVMEHSDDLELTSGYQSRDKVPNTGGVAESWNGVLLRMDSPQSRLSLEEQHQHSSSASLLRDSDDEQVCSAGDRVNDAMPAPIVDLEKTAVLAEQQQVHVENQRLVETVNDGNSSDLDLQHKGGDEVFGQTLDGENIDCVTYNTEASGGESGDPIHPDIPYGGSDGGSNPGDTMPIRVSLDDTTAIKDEWEVLVENHQYLEEAENVSLHEDNLLEVDIQRESCKGVTQDGENPDTLTCNFKAGVGVTVPLVPSDGKDTVVDDSVIQGVQAEGVGNSRASVAEVGVVPQERVDFFEAKSPGWTKESGVEEKVREEVAHADLDTASAADWDLVAHGDVSTAVSFNGSSLSKQTQSELFHDTGTIPTDLELGNADHALLRLENATSSQSILLAASTTASEESPKLLVDEPAIDLHLANDDNAISLNLQAEQVLSVDLLDQEKVFIHKSETASEYESGLQEEACDAEFRHVTGSTQLLACQNEEVESPNSLNQEKEEGSVVHFEKVFIHKSEAASEYESGLQEEAQETEFQQVARSTQLLACQNEEVQSPNSLNQEKEEGSVVHFENFLIQQPSLTESLQEPIVDTGAHNFCLLSEGGEVKLPEMPPLPPLPPLQWRMGKPQNVPSTQEVKFPQFGLGLFPPVQPSLADENPQIGFTAFEAGTPLSHNPFMSPMRLETENPAESYPCASQLPLVHGDSGVHSYDKEVKPLLGSLWQDPTFGEPSEQYSLASDTKSMQGSPSSQSVGVDISLNPHPGSPLAELAQHVEQSSLKTDAEFNNLQHKDENADSYDKEVKPLSGSPWQEPTFGELSEQYSLASDTKSMQGSPPSQSVGVDISLNPHPGSPLAELAQHVEQSSLKTDAEFNNLQHKDENADSYDKEVKPLSGSPWQEPTFGELSEQYSLASDTKSMQGSPPSQSVGVDISLNPHPGSPLAELAQHVEQSLLKTDAEVNNLQHKDENADGEDSSVMADMKQEPWNPLNSAEERSGSTDQLASLHTNESEKPSGTLIGNIPRPPRPLIEAVAAHDRSKLRKVAERVKPQLAPKLEERDSLLEQIRTKSFNLKPATATRPSIQQGPQTNLKVAAILEKANAIRQALAGSDEDDDADSWSE